MEGQRNGKDKGKGWNSKYEFFVDEIKTLVDDFEISYHKL